MVLWKGYLGAIRVAVWKLFTHCTETKCKLVWKGEQSGHFGFNNHLDVTELNSGHLCNTNLNKSLKTFYRSNLYEYT